MESSKVSQANGVLESHHRTLKHPLQTSLVQNVVQWTNHLQQACFFYINRTINDTTGIQIFLHSTDISSNL